MPQGIAQMIVQVKIANGPVSAFAAKQMLQHAQHAGGKASTMPEAVQRKRSTMKQQLVVDDVILSI